MIAIDTNVLVRILVNDKQAEHQCRLARELIAKQDAIWICREVLIETLWVLQSNYQFKKEQILLALETLRRHPDIILENADSLATNLELFATGNVGFTDCSILNEAKNNKLILHTFDKKLSKLQGAKLITDEG
jgi:predicted nucleic-acid-binding protein